METVLIAGGSGTVGKHLSKMLLEKGYEVAWLSRKRIEVADIKIHLWNVENKFIEDEAILSADYIINLSGTNIGEKRWSSKRKNKILNSRVESTKLLFEKVKKLNKNLDAFITSSAVGYYGMTTSNNIFNEDDRPATDFLGEVCNKWENESKLFEELGIRTVQVRTGVVLNRGAGALSKMMLPIKMFVGSPLGSGKQYVPWIHIEDLCNIFIKSLEDSSMTGAYNAVVPESITNSSFTKILAQQLNKPLFMPNVPSFVLTILLGEMSKLVLEGSRVSSEKIQNSGYRFLYPDLLSALNQLFSDI